MGVVIDAHSDTLLFIDRGDYSFRDGSPESQVDLPKLRAGGVTAQILALYVEPQYSSQPARRTLDLIDLAFQECERSNGGAGIVTSAREIRDAYASGRIALPLSIEGGEALEGSVAMLRTYYRLGVRLLGLTHNPRNMLADGLDASATPGGLTPFGREVLHEMERLGMIVDVSHLAAPGFWEVMGMAKRPVIASHSKVRALGHPRGLTDEQISALARTGGVIGVNVYRIPNLDAVTAMIGHVRRLAGIEHVGIGADFYGRAEAPHDLQDVSRLGRVADRLRGDGYSAGEVENVMGGNFLRVFDAVIG